MKTLGYSANEKGVALVISLMFLALLSMMGTTAYVMTTTDLSIGNNYKASSDSFFDADAGVHFAQKSIEAGLVAGTFSLPLNIGDTATLSYTLPSGFSFSLSNLTKVSDNAYALTSTGSGPDNAQTSITVRYERGSAITMAAFGDKKMEMKNSATVYSYDGRTSAPPTTPGQSTHQGDIGSNDLLITKNSSFIDGDGVNGEQTDGSPTTNNIHDPSEFYGTAPLDAGGRIDPDPLGINSGGEYDPSSYAVSNDNASADPAFPSVNTIGLGSSYPTSTMTLYGKPGGADYYVTFFELKNSTTLNIDTSKGNAAGTLPGGPVNLFIDSPTYFDIKNSAAINVLPATDGHKFAIFTDATGTLDFKNSSDFNGLLYAPLGDVVVHNSGDFNGAVWGSTVDIRNSGTLRFNTALSDLYASKDMRLASWRINNN